MSTIILLELVMVMKRLLKTIFSICNLSIMFKLFVMMMVMVFFNPPTTDEKTNYDYDIPPLFDDYGDENNDSYFVEFAPSTITTNNYAYVGSNYYMHMAHDKNVLCDDYIGYLIHDGTGNYYEN